ncbi:hypothetical protein [Sphingomonas sp.]|uniref:hypothetical protein n=1 Tax=Sphingomonas sp. TaxID=28214 RepID=UPI00286E964F|nr:hypothetical protein [Sphingomonas sp.]
MLSLIFAAALQGQPVVITPSPPPVVTASRIARPIEQSAVTTLHVRVAVAGRSLFDDTLRVGQNSGASFSQTRSEAPALPCAGSRPYSGSTQNSLNIQLYARDNSHQGPGYSVNVSWQRPVAEPDCSGEGTRGVQLNQTVPLAPGESVTIRGDAGLTVTLTRP